MFKTRTGVLYELVGEKTWQAHTHALIRIHIQSFIRKYICVQYVEDCTIVLIYIGMLTFFHVEICIYVFLPHKFTNLYSFTV